MEHVARSEGRKFSLVVGDKRHARLPAERLEFAQKTQRLAQG